MRPIIRLQYKAKRKKPHVTVSLISGRIIRPNGDQISWYFPQTVAVVKLEVGEQEEH